MNIEKLKKILKYTIYADKFNYHNQIINFLDKFYVKDNFPKILINFDLHSDVKMNTICPKNNVANWVNAIFRKYDIDEYYWVVPKHIFNNSTMVEEIFNNNTARHTFSGNYTNIEYKDFSIPLKQSFLIDFSEDKILTDSIDLTEAEIQEKINTKPNNYKLITLYICTEDNLPDFIDDEVIVSVDGDYFSNNGFDTKADYEYTPKNIQEHFDSFVECLSNKNIYPTYLGLCLSNNYIGDLKSTDEFYNILLENFNCRIKFNIEYTYTDLRDDKHDFNDIYFYSAGNYIEIVYIEDNSLSEAEIKSNFSEVLKDLKDGVYNMQFYSKKVTDSYGNTEIKIYKHENSMKKVLKLSPDLSILLNKMKSKIQNLIQNKA